MCKSICILGTERSGTNLLRAILQSHSEIVSPPPAGFVDALASFDKFYFPDQGEAKLTRFTQDLNVLISTHHNPWNMKFAEEQILANLENSPSFWSIFYAINQIYAKEHNAKIWASKEPGLFRFVNEININIPKAKFIYLVRDGRDVAASMLRGHLHSFHIFDAANAWKYSQKYCLKALSNINLKDKIYQIKYEDLIRDVKLQIQKMMDFLEIPFEEGQLEFYKNKQVVLHSNKSRFWKNLSKPVNAANSGKYKQKLNSNSLKIFETIAREEMRALGYQLDTIADLAFTDFDLKRYGMLAKFRKIIWGFDPRGEAQRNRRRFKAIHEIINRNMSEIKS